MCKDNSAIHTYPTDEEIVAMWDEYEKEKARERVRQENISWEEHDAMCVGDDDSPEDLSRYLFIDEYFQDDKGKKPRSSQKKRGKAMNTRLWPDSSF